MKLIFLTLFLIACTQASISISGSSSPEELQEFLYESLKDHKEGISRWIPYIVKSPEIPNYYGNPETQLDFIDCNTCTAAITAIKLLIVLDIPPAIIFPVIIVVCGLLNVIDPEICQGAVLSYGPSVVKIAERPDLRTRDICGILIPGCGAGVNSSLTDWDIEVDPNKPPVIIPAPLDPNLPRAQILQFTDLHLDLDYVAGTEVNCGKPEGCCRDGVGNAGEFGDFSCALPEKALDALFTHAKATHPNVKYIYLTGDYIHSAIWLYNVTENTRHHKAVTTKLADTFPDVPIYPLVGNHEPDVVNMYPPEELWSEGFDLSWMYEVLVEPFKQWIPTEELVNWKKGGYYTVRPDRDVPFRLVVLNTNICYLQNFWLPYDSVDPQNQLKWFADTMLAAEKAGEIVHILGHIQPGSGSCWSVWSEKFDRIVKRFEGIIQAQFYGHSHREYFTLAFDDERPVSASYVSPSGVTDRGHPAYKLFEVDGARGVDSTWEIMDHTTYILNITSSNSDPAGVADIKPLYTAKTEYGLTSLRPTDLYDMVVRMITDQELFERYQVAHHRGSPTHTPCRDVECKTNYLCDLVVSNSGDRSPCDRIKELINKDATKEPEATTPEPEDPSTVRASTVKQDDSSSNNIYASTVLLLVMVTISTVCLK